MKAIRKPSTDRGCVLVDSEDPSPGPGEVRIKVSMCGICGTDLHIYQWDEWSQNRIHPPLTYGHEFVGIIEAIGSGVERFQSPWHSSWRDDIEPFGEADLQGDHDPRRHGSAHVRDLVSDGELPIAIWRID